MLIRVMLCFLGKVEGVSRGIAVPFLKSFISRVFMKFNSSEASSARSERLFSGGKLVLETKATVLLMRTLKKYYSLILTKTSNSTKVCLTKNKYRY